MAPEKAPAFQFYPKDFLSDSNVLRMSMEARGVYITLLSLAWLDGAVPVEPSELARLVNLPDKQFAKVWPSVRVCFQERDGQLIQPRLEAERAKQADYRRRQSDRGASGADQRWRKHGASMAQASQDDGASIAEASQRHSSSGHPQAMPSDGSSVFSLPSSSSISEQPAAVAAAMPRYVGKQKPIPGYRRLKVFPFMVEEIMGMLGDQAEAFDIDRWLLELDSSGRVLPPNLWPWMKEAVSADAAMRGFGPAALVKGTTHTNIDAVRELLRRDGVIE